MTCMFKMTTKKSVNFIRPFHFMKVLMKPSLKAALSVTIDIFILKIMFLFFKNTLKILKFRYTF